MYEVNIGVKIWLRTRGRKSQKRMAKACTMVTNLHSIKNRANVSGQHIRTKGLILLKDFHVGEDKPKKKNWDPDDNTQLLRERDEQERIGLLSQYWIYCLVGHL
jgi:hypothetical protein